MKKINNEELHNYFIELKQNNVNFENFYAKYRSLIYAIAFSILKNKEDSDDVTQKVFVKIWNTSCKRHIETKSKFSITFSET